MTEEKPLNVHVTGVYGLIGNLVYRHLSAQKDQYDVYGSGRRTVSSDRINEEAIRQVPADHFTIADLSDVDAVLNALQGVDAVIHLGAVPDPNASFEKVLSSNVIGTYNVLEACRKIGIKRVVYASSIMVSWGTLNLKNLMFRSGKAELKTFLIPSHRLPFRICHGPQSLIRPAKSGRKESAAPIRMPTAYQLCAFGSVGSIRKMQHPAPFPNRSGAAIRILCISSNLRSTPPQRRSSRSATG